MNIESLRKNYQNDGLSVNDLHQDPFEQFNIWFQEACDADIPEPNAMILATVAAAGRPFQRTVLLKFFDQKGFVFFTNYTSRKAHHIHGNHQVSLLFPWHPIELQVAITGHAEKISSLESAKYFASRPRSSQLGAWVSRQSSIISTRKLLMNELAKVKEKFNKREIPLPDFWGGYRVCPNSFEFWQGQTSRLHDRFLYSLEQGNWTISRLSP